MTFLEVMLPAEVPQDIFLYLWRDLVQHLQCVALNQAGGGGGGGGKGWATNGSLVTKHKTKSQQNRRCSS